MSSKRLIGSLEFLITLEQDQGNWHSAAEVANELVNLNIFAYGNDHWRVTCGVVDHLQAIDRLPPDKQQAA